MARIQAIPTTNRLLAAIPRKHQEQLLANCEQVELTLAQVLNRPGKLILHAYFPIDSFISIVFPAEGAMGLEAALVGNEGRLALH